MPRASIPPRLWPTICTRVPRRSDDRLEARLELGGGVERAADVGVDVRAVGAEARAGAASGAMNASVASPAMKPGTSSTGSAARATPRGRRTAWPSGCAAPRAWPARSGRPRPRRCASLQHRCAAGGFAKPSGSRNGASAPSVTCLTVGPSRMPGNCISGQFVSTANVRLTDAMSSSARSRAKLRPCRSPRSCSRRSSAGIELCYQTFGDPDDEPLVLVMGLGGPMTWWDPDLCRAARPRGLLRRPLRQPRHRPLQPGAGPGHPGHAGARVRRAAGCGRRTRSTTWPTTRSA